MNIISKFIKYGLPLLGVVALSSPLVASAQASPYGNRSDAQLTTASDAYYPPAVYISSITLASDTPINEIEGTFHVQNKSEDIIGDIKYRFDIVSPLQKGDGKQVIIGDDPIVYSQTVSPEIFALIPKEERDIKFSLPVPPLPSGEYRFRVQLLTSQGKEMGWDNAAFEITTNDDAFATLAHGPISVPAFKNEVIPPTFGVNVAAGSPFTLTAEGTNTSTLSLSAIPTLDIYAFGLTGKKVSSQTFPSVTIAPRATKAISIPLTAQTDPGVYYAVLTLRTSEGAQASSVADYRWIVQGESARIISARIAKLETMQGEKVMVNIDYAGPADTKTPTQAALQVSVLDQQGVAGTLQIKDGITLSDSITSGEASVTLDRNLVGAPGLEVTLSDPSGKVLDTYTVTIPLTDQQLQSVTGTSPTSNPDAPASQSSSKNSIMAALGVLLLMLVVGYAIWKKQSISSSVSSILLLLLLGSGFMAFPAITEAGIRVVFPKTGPEVGGDWRTLRNYIVEIFVNKPIHDATYPKENVPLEFTVKYGASNSTVSYAKNFFRYAPGVRLSAYEGPWINLGNASFSSQDACPGGANRECFVPTTYSTPADAGLNFADQPADATQSTLQLISKWGFGSEPSDTLPATADGLSGLADVINTWVNFATAQPTTQPTPLVCAENARMAVDFLEVKNRRRNDHPTLAISYFGNGEVARDGVFVDLTRNGQPVIDGSLPFNVNGLAVNRADGFVEFQIYSQGRDNRGRECVNADIILQNAHFTGFQNVGGNWRTRSERPQDGRARFCRLVRDEVVIQEVTFQNGDNFANMVSAAGPGNDTFRLNYETTAPAGTPVCTVTPTPTPTPVPPTPTPTPVTPPDLSFRCRPQFNTVQIGQPITLHGEFNGAPVSSHWIADDSQNPRFTGNSYTTAFATLGRKQVTAAMPGANGGVTISTCDVQVVPDPSFRCRPQWNNVGVNLPITFHGELNGETITSNWIADDSQNPRFTGTLYTTAFSTPGRKQVGASVADGPLAGYYSTCDVQVKNDDTPPGPTQCSNDVDDDDPEDTKADEFDPGCHTDGIVIPDDPTRTYDATDDDERDNSSDGIPQCRNGVDDDDPEDIDVDANDDGCHTDGDADDGDDTYDSEDDDERDSSPSTTTSPTPGSSATPNPLFGPGGFKETR